MKFTFVFKLFYALGLSALSAHYVVTDHAKWHGLGRDAFLAHEGHRFDIYMATASSDSRYYVIYAILAFGFFALYEVAGYLGGRLDSVLQPKVTPPAPKP
jgi:hypothetical protein